MNEIKPIETYYKGYKFRSRLEARVAVLFDALGANWEYEPEGYTLADGTKYLPDFLIYGGYQGRTGEKSFGDLYVEVKGNMTDEDAKKINLFSETGRSVLIIDCIPWGKSFWDLIDEIVFKALEGPDPSCFNFETIDGDCYPAFPVTNGRRFMLVGPGYNYLGRVDEDATLKAYNMARQARFEHGEVPATCG